MLPSSSSFFSLLSHPQASTIEGGSFPPAPCGYLPSPQARWRGTPSHQVSGTGGKRPHEVNVEFLVPQESQSMGQESLCPNAAMAAFAEPDVAQAGLDPKVPKELEAGCTAVSQKLDGEAGTCQGFPAHSRALPRAAAPGRAGQCSAVRLLPRASQQIIPYKYYALQHKPTFQDLCFHEFSYGKLLVRPIWRSRVISESSGIWEGRGKNTYWDQEEFVSVKGTFLYSERQSVRMQLG